MFIFYHVLVCFLSLFPFPPFTIFFFFLSFFLVCLKFCFSSGKLFLTFSLFLVFFLFYFLTLFRSSNPDSMTERTPIRHWMLSDRILLESCLSIFIESNSSLSLSLSLSHFLKFSDKILETKNLQPKTPQDLVESREKNAERKNNFKMKLWLRLPFEDEFS